jgi:hypothetical protein
LVGEVSNRLLYVSDVSYEYDKSDIQLDDQLALPVRDISIQFLHDIRYEGLAE